jgi:hypothetical protein
MKAGSTFEAKASSSMGIDGGSALTVKAGIIKIN